MEQLDGFPNYEVLAQHDDKAGIGIRKHLMNVFWLLLIVTLIELVLGFMWTEYHFSGSSKTLLIVAFITFTIIKGGYIVMSFMHLGHENKSMRWMVLGPYFTFITYLIYMLTVTEGSYSYNFRDLLNPITKTAQVVHKE